MHSEIDATDMGRTTISVSDELADELYERKGRGESYEDVLWRLLEETGGQIERESEEGEEAETTEEQPSDLLGTEVESPAPTIEDLVDQVGRDVLPGSGAKLDERVEALRAVVDYLREHGTATPADFKNEVYPAHTARYTDGENPARSWWKNCMYPGLKELAERSEEIAKADETGEWNYRRDES